MISESHSDWNLWPLRSSDRDVGERVGPVRVRAGDVDVGLSRHAHVADRVRPGEATEVVLVGHLLRVAEVLDDLE